MSTRTALILFCSLPFWATALIAQVAARVEVGHPFNDSSKVVSIEWSTLDEQKWHQENDGRLDIVGINTAIHSAELATSKSKTTTYSFLFQEKVKVEFLIKVNNIEPGEELFLYDETNRIIVCDFAKQPKNIFLSPSFDPEKTKLIWKSPVIGAYKSDFEIENVYIDHASSARVMDIGFGTALACQPNAACKQDSMLKLISNSAVRIRMVMEEGIGWCTGSFINTTRNDKTPYLLTAFHCQYDYTPLYDNWRFDLQYKSEQCENPATEPQYFSLTGCKLIASGQASDFLMVLLDDHIPINQAATFVGWDRDEALIPDTSYLIHHPNADIRKISTSVNDATIHPNQIGWKEGYSTPSFHHFRTKFTEGGYQGGSSGGPFFNEQGYLVGQLHGGTAGCDAISNVFVGRLARSWSLGDTPQGRLSDWLDPDMTGLIRIPSIENIGTDEIVSVRGLITDPKGRPVSNAIIKVTGSVNRTITTGHDGVFEISDINRNGQYTITPEKHDYPTNGVNAIDLIAIQKHLLGKDFFDFDWQLISADATNNVVVNVGDVVLLQRLLLGKIQTFPSSPSWRFEPSQVNLTSIPPGQPEELLITAIKIGDANGTADPSL